MKAQDDSSLDAPRWWKDFADNKIGSKKIGIELMANLGFKSSGDLFVVYSECDTKLLMEVLGTLVGKITGQNSGGGLGMPGLPGAGGPGLGGPPPGIGGPAPGLPGGIVAPGGL